jgi:hypothetical protein
MAGLPPRCGRHPAPGHRRAVAFLALSHIIASLTAASGRTGPWQRTDKFRPLSSPAGRQTDTARGTTESFLTVSCLLAAAGALAAMPHRGPRDRLTRRLPRGRPPESQNATYVDKSPPTTFALEQHLPAVTD